LEDEAIEPVETMRTADSLQLTACGLGENESRIGGGLPRAKTPHEQESLKRTIVATDNQIDELGYELYGLMEEEVRIVEGGRK
jgi:hypothetical protein